MEKEFDVFGIGNPLIDILIKVESDKLIELNLKKGTMHLIDKERANLLYDEVSKKDIKITPAGACPNTIMGVANLGGKCVLCGKIGSDDRGDIYEDVITKDNIKSCLVRTSAQSTGQVISFITPDSERTMATHLGAAITLQKQDVFEEDIVKSKVIYLTGYVLEAPNLREAALHAISIAKENNVKVAIDLADPELIRRNIDDLRKIVNEHADILFLNESEAEVFSGVGAEEAVHKVAENVEIAIVKLGKKGALVKSGSDVYNVQGHVVDAVDTTGAGDLFAAGFLYAFTQGKSLDKCAASGNLVASKIVQQIGAKLEYSIKEEIDKI